MDDSDDPDRARPVGVNHVALEVGDVEAALDLYGDLLSFELRGWTDSSAFIDMGDQFIALAEGDTEGVDDHRHVGLVVDDPELLEDRLDATDAERLPTRGLDFRDPWGNRFQVVGYEEVQFTKAQHVGAAMGIDSLEKTESALAELAEKGRAPEDG